MDTIDIENNTNLQIIETLIYKYKEELAQFKRDVDNWRDRGYVNLYLKANESVKRCLEFIDDLEKLRVVVSRREIEARHAAPDAMEGSAKYYREIRMDQKFLSGILEDPKVCLVESENDSDTFNLTLEEPDFKVELGMHISVLQAIINKLQFRD